MLLIFERFLNMFSSCCLRQRSLFFIAACLKHFFQTSNILVLYELIIKGTSVYSLLLFPQSGPWTDLDQPTTPWQQTWVSLMDISAPESVGMPLNTSCSVWQQKLVVLFKANLAIVLAVCCGKCKQPPTPVVSNSTVSCHM